MNPTLKEAIENLYQVFEKYALGNLHHFPDRLPKEHAAILKNKNLRDLTADNLSGFIYEAVYTWYNDDDFKYFLPRILELIARLDNKVDESTIFKKMDYYEWQEWDKEEIEAVNNYLKSLWIELLNTDIDFFEDFYSEIFEKYTNTSELLQIWENNESKPALKHLAKFIYSHIHEILNHTLFYSPLLSDQLHTWLLTAKMEDKLWQAYLNYQNESFVSDLANSYDILVILRKANS